MLLLKKVLTYFLILPPGNISLILTLVGIYLFRKSFKRLGGFLTFLGFTIYLPSTEMVASLIISPLERKFLPPPETVRDRCQIIVTLGGDIKRDVPFLDLKNDSHEDSFKRIVAAYKLYKEKPRPIVVSGYSVIEQFSEAKVMKHFLEYFGVPSKDIISEEKSRDTYENALQVKDIVGNKTLCLITSAYHMERAIYLFSKVGFNRKQITPIPVDYKESNSPFSVYKLLPTPYWFYISAKAIKEYVGLVFYHLKD